MTDRDSDALEEIIQRKYEVSNPKLNKRSAKSDHHMALSVRELDLTDSAEKSLNKLQQFRKASAIVINFAIHYILTSADALSNLFTLVDSLLDFGGKFVFTCFNGEDIMGLDPEWDVMVDGELKYSIHRTGNKMPQATATTQC